MINGEAPPVPWDGIDDRRLKAYRMRRDGLTYREIAAQLGINLKTAHTDVQTVRREAIRETVDEMRDTELDKLDRNESIALESLGLVDAAGRAALISTLVKIQESRRKLLGMDSPTRVEYSPMQITINGVDTDAV